MRRCFRGARHNRVSRLHRLLTERRLQLVDNDVSFRWLGVAGIELTAGGRTLAVDPFFTRPPLRRFLFGRVASNPRLVRKHLPSCDYVLVSHSHWDHMMDAPEGARNTGAVVFRRPTRDR